MFKFNFDLEDISTDSDFGLVQAQSTNVVVEQNKSSGDEIPVKVPCKEISIHDLLNVLPSLISCSPLTIPLRDGSKVITLSRRDLFDARFQLIAEGLGSDETPTLSGTETLEAVNGEVNEDENLEKAEEQRHNVALKFIEAPSDLVPRVYEGGLKTWECSIDLVEYLNSTQPLEGFRGKDVLELGCGTAVPSLYILHHIFSRGSSNDSVTRETTIYLQDYNDSVLELVTLPNILLTWYLSPASLSFRASNSTSPDSGSDALPFPQTPEPLELPITTSLKTAFLTSLKSYNISLRFFSGSWSSFMTQLPTLHTKPFNLVLTSETIYRMDSLPSLIEIMRLACTPKPDTINKDENQKAICLVAAKVLYFGVGGGASDFVNFVEGNGYAKTQVVWERKTGVGRLIMLLDF